MAGIGGIGGGIPRYPLGPAAPSVVSNGRDPSGVLGTRAGLGETNSVDPDTGRPIEDNKSAGSGLRSATEDLTDDEQKQVQELKQRDQEVRRHEQAHLAAAGRYANGGPQFEFTTGPDGRQYATGGHVSIDVSPANTPEATIQKAQVIRRAALAPAEPSAQDRAVATAASKLETSARREIQQARQGEASGGAEASPTASQSADEAEEAPTPILQPAPSLSRRGISEYTPPQSGGATGARRLDLQA